MFADVVENYSEVVVVKDEVVMVEGYFEVGVVKIEVEEQHIPNKP